MHNKSLLFFNYCMHYNQSQQIINHFVNNNGYLPTKIINTTLYPTVIRNTYKQDYTQQQNYQRGPVKCFSVMQLPMQKPIYQQPCIQKVQYKPYLPIKFVEIAKQPVNTTAFRSNQAVNPPQLNKNSLTNTAYFGQVSAFNQQDSIILGKVNYLKENSSLYNTTESSQKKYNENQNQLISPKKVVNSSSTKIANVIDTAAKYIQSAVFGNDKDEDKESTQTKTNSNLKFNTSSFESPIKNNSMHFSFYASSNKSQYPSNNNLNYINLHGVQNAPNFPTALVNTVSKKLVYPASVNNSNKTQRISIPNAYRQMQY